MRIHLSEYKSYFVASLQRRWVKIALYIWMFVGAYDQFIAQFVPRYVQDAAPRIYEVLVVTSGWLPWWAWGWIGTAILTTAMAETALAAKRTMESSKPAESEYPISVFQPPSETKYGITKFYAVVENTSLTSVVEDISVVLEGIKRWDSRHVYRVNVEFQTDRGARFTLRPGERSWVTIGSSRGGKMFLGPLINGWEIEGYDGIDDDDFINNSVLQAAIVARNLTKKNISFSCHRQGMPICLVPA